MTGGWVPVADRPSGGEARGDTETLQWSVSAASGRSPEGQMKLEYAA